jgi:hypothetical protein
MIEYYKPKVDNDNIHRKYNKLKKQEISRTISHKPKKIDHNNQSPNLFLFIFNVVITMII